MDKEKQIEEIAQKFCPYESNKRLYGCDCYKCQKALMERCETLKLATEIYNADYRKINDNEIVISKEEYERLSIFTLTTARQIMEQARKETAEKILKWLINSRHLSERTHEIGFKKPRTSYLVVNDEIEEFAKEFGVDLGEEND